MYPLPSLSLGSALPFTAKTADTAFSFLLYDAYQIKVESVTLAFSLWPAAFLSLSHAGAFAPLTARIASEVVAVVAVVVEVVVIVFHTNPCSQGASHVVIVVVVVAAVVAIVAFVALDYRERGYNSWCTKTVAPMVPPVILQRAGVEGSFMNSQSLRAGPRSWKQLSCHKACS